MNAQRKTKMKQAGEDLARQVFTYLPECVRELPRSRPRPIQRFALSLARWIQLGMKEKVVRVIPCRRMLELRHSHFLECPANYGTQLAYTREVVARPHEVRVTRSEAASPHPGPMEECLS